MVQTRQAKRAMHSAASAPGKLPVRLRQRLYRGTQTLLKLDASRLAFADPR
jgi:hypothetical protein